MAKDIDLADFQLPTNLLEASLEPSPEPLNNVARTSLEAREPKSAKELAAQYQVGDRTFQTWFKAVCAAYPWIDPKTLKTGSGNKIRYTPLCQALVAEYRAVSTKLSEEAWIASVHAANSEKLATSNAPSAPAEIPISPTEVMLPTNGDRPGGMVLHIGSSLALPPIPGVIPPGNDTAYLTQAQQRLQQFEALQQQVIAQMEQQQKESEDLNAQYQEATRLSDQLLLQEFQLKGIQLGYTALKLKQQAFKATIQAAETGTLPAPGKPQSEDGQPQSA